ncbi:MAG: ABC transporter ATP-binding protein [bacterium]|nr:ABC transporter ATP-binding protein [bacterium]
MIEVQGLTKLYGSFPAVRGIAFHVARGEIFGLLGPNGAGKTSTISMLIGLSRISAGAVRIAGYDATREMPRIQRDIGVVPDESNLYDELEGLENLCFSGALYGMTRKRREQRAAELLDQFGLQAVGSKPFKTYSKGMKRKLTIAAALMHEPSILFLDEPTSGIDVASARQIRQNLKDMNERGTTIFLTTHYIEEAGRLCDRIALMVEGRIVRIGTPDELMSACQREHIIEITTAGPLAGVAGELAKVFSHVRVRVTGESTLRLQTDHASGVGPFVVWLHERGVPVVEATLIRPTLEDAFVALTSVDLAEMKRERERNS